ncbi:MAG TPA: PE-PPE domain-containing protein [Mycobacterium sp.]|nr:PE-PPE domain-containing protein [Mycobacterium sp.]
MSDSALKPAGGGGARWAAGLGAVVAVGLGAVVAAAGLVAAPVSSVGGQPVSRIGDVRLTGGDHAPLGDGVALVMGPSMISTPSQQYVDTVDSLFLQPHGFTGTAVALTTPESPYNLAQSEIDGAQILTAAVQNQIAGGHVDAANPVVVFGYSQSAAFVTLAMQQLQAQGVPSDDVHFVLIGDPASPNGGWLTSLAAPGVNITLPGANIPLGNPTPGDLYPTDVYTLEYDGYADHPHYPLNLLSLLNSYMGLVLEHTAYLGLTPDQIASAIPQETATDSLANYYMIPSDTLPLLDPLRLIPVFGQPLYDLLEPDMRILVNLGYGNITDGWNQGLATTQTGDVFYLFPPDTNWADVSAALSSGASEGWSNAVADLLNPNTYQIPTLEDSPVLEPIIAAAFGAGIIPDPTVSSISELVGGFLTAVSSSLVDPVAADFGLSADALAPVLAGFGL